MDSEDDDPASGSTLKIVLQYISNSTDTRGEDTSHEMGNLEQKVSQSTKPIAFGIGSETLDLYNEDVVDTTDRYDTMYFSQSSIEPTSNYIEENFAQTAKDHIHKAIKPLSEMYRFIEGIVEGSKETISYAGELMIKALDFWTMVPKTSNGTVSLSREIYLSLHMQNYKVNY
jgi:hypothetical protein